MKCYIVTGRGVYLAAYAVVFAPDEAAARADAIKLFCEHRLCDKNWADELEVRKVLKSGAHLISDGDY